MPRTKDYYTVEEVADEFSVTPAAVRDWIRKHKLMAYQPSGERGVYRIPVSAVTVLRMRIAGQERKSQGPRTIVGRPLDVWAERISPVCKETGMSPDEILRRMMTDQALVVRYPTFATDYASYVADTARTLKVARA
jgi:excisionase family DNA binding protein